MQLSPCSYSPIGLVHAPVTALFCRDSGGGEGVSTKAVYLYFKIANGVNSGKKNKVQRASAKILLFLENDICTRTLLSYYSRQKKKEEKKKPTTRVLINRGLLE